ncbi:hypothetical protein F2Q68_00001174 [Brassica cretica]|uniref:KH type-2 domain-containing protein n=1 Tax=Brassica cretica TaxID=69181 RepID=A0A8S9JDB3_BRACR|nr:hypothetical protein F2Q68_00001174 [Brassica cretica]
MVKKMASATVDKVPLSSSDCHETEQQIGSSHEISVADCMEKAASVIRTVPSCFGQETEVVQETKSPTIELAEDGYSGVEVRVTPMRTEIIIRATRTQNVLGEKGRRIRELTSLVQKRFRFFLKTGLSVTLRRLPTELLANLRGHDDGVSVPSVSSAKKVNPLKTLRNVNDDESTKNFTPSRKEYPSPSPSKILKPSVPTTRKSSPTTIKCHSSNQISSHHKRKLRSLILCPVNEQLFATSSLDGMVSLWQLQPGRLAASLLSTTDCLSQKQRRWGEDMVWHPSGHTLFSVYTADDGDSQISILNLNKTPRGNFPGE